jgi:tight adherence protein C
MTAVVLALAWGGVSAGLLGRRRPVVTVRALALVPAAAPAPIGGVFGDAIMAALPTPRRAAAVLLIAMSVGMLFPPLGVVVLLAACARPITAQRRARAERDSAVERELADVVALVGLGVSAGCNLTGALEAATVHVDGALGAALRGALVSARRGNRIADALELLPEQLGESVRPFVAALVSCDRYGAALGPTLERLALDTRTASRQRAEAAARRLPVRLLFPLVTCILPAFALLTVAPLIAGSFQGLGL